MSTLLCFGLGAAYAVCLWSMAVCVARRRALALGELPFWIPILCGLVAAGAASFLPLALGLAAATSLIGAVVCALVDARTGFIFDALSFTMILVAGAIGLYDGRFAEGAMAVAVVGGLLGALYVFSGRRGIGLGDVKLGCAIALGYGIQAALIAIGSAFILGAAYAIAMIGLGRAKRTDSLRFGPFIAGGAAVGLTIGVTGPLW